MTTQTDRLNTSPTYDGSPIRGAAFSFTMGLGDAAPTTTSGSLKTNPTLAAGDVMVSKDGGAYANITTLPSTYPSASNTILVSLSATEMEAAIISVRFADQTATKEWCDSVVSILTENP